jgi:serine protease
MKKKLQILAFAFFVLLANFQASFSQRAIEPNAIPGEFIVQFKRGVNVPQMIAQWNETLNLGQDFLVAEEELSKPWCIWWIKFPSTHSAPLTLLNWIRIQEGVKLAQYNHTIEERVLEPNDPNYTNGNQWSMNNTGQSGGLADADIDAPEAWEISTGGFTAHGDTIVVAVIDGGFSLSHQDLNFWKNHREIPGNGIDDDGNGYVDDYNGWNAFNNNATMPTTGTQHGTHVSGTVGARGNNNIGVVGVNWNMKVMPIAGSSGQEVVVVRAYTYAYVQRLRYNQTNGDSGAFVVATNSSFGVNNGNPANYPVWCAMYDSMGTVGILSAGATANANYNIDVTGDMPTACPSNHLVAVTNTNRLDEKNSGAAYGLTTIDLGAPGTTIISTNPSNAYGNSTGTSMATPHVAGAIALMYSAACPQLIADYKNYPDSIALIMKSFLLASTDSITALQGITVTGGRLNIHKALMKLDDYNCVVTSSEKMISSVSKLELISIHPNPSSNYIELFYSTPFNSISEIRIFDLSGREVYSTQKGEQLSGYRNHIIPLDNFSNGLYFVRIVQEGNLSNTMRFIKN